MSIGEDIANMRLGAIVSAHKQECEKIKADVVKGLEEAAKKCEDSIVIPIPESSTRLRLLIKMLELEDLSVELFPNETMQVFLKYPWPDDKIKLALSVPDSNHQLKPAHILRRAGELIRRGMNCDESQVEAALSCGLESGYYEDLRYTKTQLFRRFVDTGIEKVTFYSTSSNFNLLPILKEQGFLVDSNSIAFDVALPKLPQ